MGANEVGLEPKATRPAKAVEALDPRPYLSVCMRFKSGG